MNIKKRNVLSCIIFSLITFGIYSIYWAVKIGKDAISYADPEDAGTVEIILMIFFPFIGYYLAEKKFYDGAQKHGFLKSDNSLAYLLLGLFGFSIINMCMMQNDLNIIVDQSIML